MKKDKKNIKQALTISGVISVFTTLGIGSLCFTMRNNDPNIPKRSFIYEATEDGNIDPLGKVPYNEVASWFLLEKELTNGSQELFIADNVFVSGIIDVQNGKPIVSSSVDESILNTEDLWPYLITYGMVKEYYTPDDINQLLSQIKEDYPHKELKKRIDN